MSCGRRLQGNKVRRGFSGVRGYSLWYGRRIITGEILKVVEGSVVARTLEVTEQWHRFEGIVLVFQRAASTCQEVREGDFLIAK